MFALKSNRSLKHSQNVYSYVARTHWVWKAMGTITSKLFKPLSQGGGRDWLTTRFLNGPTPADAAFAFCPDLTWRPITHQLFLKKQRYERLFDQSVTTSLLKSEPAAVVREEIKSGAANYFYPGAVNSRLLEIWLNCVIFKRDSVVPWVTLSFSNPGHSGFSVQSHPTPPEFITSSLLHLSHSAEFTVPAGRVFLTTASPKSVIFIGLF